MSELQDLWEKIRDVRVAMLTTTEQDGSLRSRPMYTQQAEFDGDLWFFTADDSGKVAEIRADSDVNLAYAEPKDSRYVSVSGKAELVKDRAKIDELWSPMLKAWFNGGKDDPHLALLRVRVSEAEYWDDTQSKMSKLFGMVKAVTGSGTYESNEHGVVKP
jgi:general stress protein 26